MTVGVFWPSDANRDNGFTLPLLGLPVFVWAVIFFRHDKDVPKQNKTLLSIELQTVYIPESWRRRELHVVDPALMFDHMSGQSLECHSLENTGGLQFDLLGFR